MLLCPFLFPQSHYYVVEKIQKGMLPSLTLITLISVGPLSPLDCTELSLSLALWAKLHTATTFMGSMQHLLAAQGALHLPPPRDNCSHSHWRSFALGWGEGGVRTFRRMFWYKNLWLCFDDCGLVVIWSCHFYWPFVINWLQQQRPTLTHTGDENVLESAQNAKVRVLQIKV